MPAASTMDDLLLRSTTIPVAPTKKLDPRRWYVLAVFVMLTTNQCLVWFTFSSASTPGVPEYYGFGDGTIDLLLNWGPIVGILVQPFATSLLSQPNGLRRTMRLVAVLTFGCCAVRLVPSLLTAKQRRSVGAHWVLHAAQALNAAAGPLIMGSCSHLSATWFPPEQRATATAVAYCGGNIGATLGFALGPLVIADVATNTERCAQPPPFNMPTRGASSRAWQLLPSRIVHTLALLACTHTLSRDERDVANTPPCAPHTGCHAMLCAQVMFMLCCVMLCCVVLCYVML
jgi:nitrate/nitrite transporter NarK